jgi:transcription elongation GreA/GreB family factor
MPASSHVKNAILNQLREKVQERLESAKEGIKSIIESRSNETKSSAGDKYETSRAMMQQEQDQLEQQISQAREQLLELSRINPELNQIKAETGSLVLTELGNYFISIGAGKVITEQLQVYTISIASPIGMALKGHKSGDVVEFGEKKFRIQSIQ